VKDLVVLLEGTDGFAGSRLTLAFFIGGPLNDLPDTLYSGLYTLV